jgi:protein-S-isoprenylcysteine O-methyltransferase Ste14
LAVQPPGRARRGRATPAERRVIAIGATVIVLLGMGWFALSHLVMGTGAADAIGESLGVVLALLVAVSIVGAIRSTRHLPR